MSNILTRCTSDIKDELTMSVCIYTKRHAHARTSCFSSTRLQQRTRHLFFFRRQLFGIITHTHAVCALKNKKQTGRAQLTQDLYTVGILGVRVFICSFIYIYFFYFVRLRRNKDTSIIEMRATWKREPEDRRLPVSLSAAFVHRVNIYPFSFWVYSMCESHCYL